jgi:hypothetical protein
MKLRNFIRNKKLLFLVLLPTAVLATAFVVYITKDVATVHEQQGKDVLASVEDKGEGLVLSEALDQDSLDSEGFATESFDAFAPLLAKLNRGSSSSQIPISDDGSQQSDDTSVGTFFKKDRELVLLADKSDQLPIIAKNDEGQPEAYEVSPAAPSSDADPLLPLAYLNHDPDGGNLQPSTLQAKSSGGLDSLTPVPEPATMFFLGTGLIVLVALGKKLKK